jgi:uncharacterized alpha-E superfamily protein
MLSRVAENLYWIGRYVERAENVARLLDVAFHLELDSAMVGPEPDMPTPIESVLSILGYREAYARLKGRRDLPRDGVLRFLTLDRGGEVYSMAAMLARARENARASREALSSDAWNQLNKLHLALKTRKREELLAQSPLRFFEGVKQGCILFDGLVDSTLPRTEAYHFLQLGRNLERVNQIVRILQIQVPLAWSQKASEDHPLAVVGWANVLRSCSAHEAYVREHHDGIEPGRVVRFLVLNACFPRAVLYCLEECGESLRALSGSEGEGSYATEAERQLGRLKSEMRFVDVNEIFDQGLQSFLVGILRSCNRIGDEIHHTYFFS